jgi:hypothetical protein
MQNVKELKIGRYSVKIGKFPNGFRFNIFAHDKSLFGKGVEDTEENAIEAARSLISQRKQQKLSERVDGIPTAEEFVEAFAAIKPSDAQWEMLKAHYNAPDKKLTSDQLADAAGYEHMYGANTQYGILGHNLSDHLEYMPPGKYKDGQPLWITILVNHEGQSFEEDTGHFQHEMREEVIAALEMMGF